VSKFQFTALFDPSKPPDLFCSVKTTPQPQGCGVFYFGGFEPPAQSASNPVRHPPAGGCSVRNRAMRGSWRPVSTPPIKIPNAKAFGILLFTSYLFTITLTRIGGFDKVRSKKQ